MESAVRAIQQKFRAKRHREQVLLQVRRAGIAAVTIQRWYRRSADARRRSAATVIIQRWWRGYRATRAELQRLANFRLAATSIQSLWRGRRCRTQFQQLKHSAIVIQRAFRARLTFRRERSRFIRTEAAAVVVQKWWRLKIEQNRRRIRSDEPERREKACIAIQRWWRRHTAARLEKLRSPRGGNGPTEPTSAQSADLHSAALLFQAVAKGLLVRRRMKEKRHADLDTSSGPSTSDHVPSVGRTGDLRRYDEMKSPGSDNLASSTFRDGPSTSAGIPGDGPSISDSPGPRSMGRRRGPLDAERAAVVIQAFWRGHRVRCEYMNTNLTKVRSGIQRANASASQNEESRLGNRTYSSLQYLLECRSLYYITCSVKHLMVSSAMSEVCCRKIVDGDALETIVKLIDNSNRSVPHIKLVFYCVSVLLNISKCTYHAKAIWETDRLLEVLCNIINIYHLKEKDIFNKCCSLLWNLAQDLQIQTMLKTDESFCKKLQKWHRNLSKRDLTPKKARIASKRGTHIACLPIQPDWVLGRCHLREFQNNLLAINSLMYILHLSTEP